MNDIHWLRKLNAPHFPCGRASLGQLAERSPQKVTCQKCKAIAELAWQATAKRMAEEAFVNRKSTR